jgi:hypothetical protein
MTGEVRLDDGNIWANGFPDTAKPKQSGHRMAAGKLLFPRRWYGGMISTDLEVIWEISAKRPILV